MRRITFVGSIGAGKTTLATALGQKLGRDVVHLDDLWWEPGSYQRTPEAATARTVERERWLELNQDLADGETWIIDGSLHLLAIRLRRADTVVFADLPRRVCVPRVVKRWLLPFGRQRHASPGLGPMAPGPASLGLEVPGEAGLDTCSAGRARPKGDNRPPPKST